ncbi:MAG: lytic transglycosylase domain-containing protein [Acidimicrobiales bacterium]
MPDARPLIRPPIRLLLVAAMAVVGSCAKPAERSPLHAAQPATSTSTIPRPSTTTVPMDLFSLRPPPPADDPILLAQQIEVAENTLRDPASTDDAAARAALAQQVAYRQLGVHPEWDDTVKANLPAHLQRAADLNMIARREFRAMHTRLPTVMPAWRIVEPAPAPALLDSYREAAATFGVAWEYLAAINLVETGFGRIRGTSTAGAQGPMQFMPATWDAYGNGGDINDVHDAIMGAGRYLAANNGATDIGHALFRYNHSEHYVRGVQLYAELIREHPQAFLAYYRWGIWYLTERGEVYLPVGYEEVAPVPVEEYLARR